eukprot:14262660-Alexandrium_andersonii.AAC.1
MSCTKAHSVCQRPRLRSQTSGPAQCHAWSRCAHWCRHATLRLPQSRSARSCHTMWMRSVAAT